MDKFKKVVTLAVIGALFVLCLSSCGNKDEKVGDIATIRWYIFSLPGNVNESDIYAKAAEMVKAKLNVNLELIPIESGNYEAKMQVLNAAAEPLDIMFVSNWLNNYYSNVSKGALTELDEYLKETPELFKLLPDYYWEVAKVNGKIYAVPNQQIAARAPCFAIPKQNVELLGLNLDDYKNEGKDYKSALAACEKYLRLVKEKTGQYSNLNQIWFDGTSLFKMEEVLGSKLPGAIFYNGNKNLTLVNQYESEEFKYYIEMRRKWVKEGLVMQGKEGERDLSKVEDKTKPIPILNRVNSYRPGMLSELNRKSVYDWEILMKTEPVMSSGALTATMNAISSTSKNPLKALKVLEMVNTDKVLYNLLVYGIEGVNYTKIGENRVELNKKNPFTWTEWNVGNTFNVYLLPDQEDTVIEETKKINDESFRSPLLGFNPDLTKIKPQIAACQSAISEFLDVLDYGLVDTDVAYAEFIKKLKAAGSDEMIRNVQAQIDEWVQKK